jgi:hypothetical protein
MATFVFVRLSDINNTGAIGVRCSESVDAYFSNHGSLLRGLSIQYTPMGIEIKPPSQMPAPPLTVIADERGFRIEDECLFPPEKESK